TDNGASGGNSYTPVISYASSYPGFGSWASANVSKAATAVTVTGNGGVTIGFLTVIVVPVGGVIGSTGTTNNGTSANLTTSGSNSWVVGVLAYNQTLNAWTSTGAGTSMQSTYGPSGHPYSVDALSDFVAASGTPVTFSGTISGSGYSGVNLIEVK